MSILQNISRRLSAAFAACALLAAAAPSQAAVIAVFDPPFGPAFPTLGFKGQATFDVTAGCYALGSGLQSTGGACQITALSALVNFYNAADPTTTPLTTVPLDGSYFSSTYVFGFYHDPLTGQITGFGTNDSAIFSVVVPSLGITTSMVLYFQLPPPPPPVVGIAAFAAAAPVAGVGGAFLRNCSSTVEGCSSRAIDTSAPARLTVSVVPEPDSVALALLGLGALVAARRRKLPR